MADQDEPDDLDWRLAEFERLGFDWLTCLALAWSDTSVSAVRELLRKGCPLETVCEIVL